MYKVIKNKQKGLAIVSVIVIVAIISTIVAINWKQQSEHLKMAKYKQQQQQLLNNIYSVEDYAKVILKNDEDRNIDSFNEDWSKEAIAELPDSVAFGKIIDLQSTLSINNIVNIDNPYSISWGSSYYCLNGINKGLQQLQMSDLLFFYFTAKTPEIAYFDDVSELRKIEGMLDDDYYKIKPYLNSLPKGTKINVNTAPKLIIACLHPYLSEYLIDSFIGKRPFYSVNQAVRVLSDILQLPVNSAGLQHIKKMIAVRSEYFLLNMTINKDNKTIVSNTIFNRKNDAIRVVNRSYYQR
jgi:general secretion pathway protein K